MASRRATQPSDYLPSEVLDELALMIVDDRGVVRQWSAGCEALYGWRAAEIVGAVRQDMLKTSIVDGTGRRPAGSAGRARLIEELHRDGDPLQLLEQLLPLDATDRQAVLVVACDRAAIANPDDGVRLALALEMHAIGLFTYHVASQRIEWREDRRPSPGFEARTMTLDGLAAASHGPSTATIVALCRDAIRTGSDIVEFELPIGSSMAGGRTLRCRARLVRDGQGDVDRFVGVMQDVTDVGIRERALRDRQAVLDEVLDTASDAIIVVDGDGTIGSFNRSAQQLFGHATAAMAGQPIGPLIEGGWPVIRSAIAQAGLREMTAIHASGHQPPVELRVGSLPDHLAWRHILVFTDISARRAKEARRTLFEHNARDIAVAEYAVQLMHEMNQPLAAASNFLAVAHHLASQNAQSKELGGMIGMALSQIQRLGGVIRSTQRKATGEDIDPRLVPVRAAIEEAVAVVDVAHGAGGVKIAIHVDTDAETILFDPIGIQQVLANLLRNAIEAFGPVVRPGALIEVRSHRVDRRLLLSVSDNGPGIPESALTDLFEPFRHRDKRTGMGLGLSICRTLVEAHGGTLSAANRATGGACFTLALPLDDQYEPA